MLWKNGLVYDCLHVSSRVCLNLRLKHVFMFKPLVMQRLVFNLFRLFIKSEPRTGMKAQTYNLSIGETEAGREVLGQSGLHSKTLSQQRYKASQQYAL